MSSALQGGIYHAIAEEAISFKEIAAVVASGLNLPVIGINPKEATEHFGASAQWIGADVPASSKLTRAYLKWEPKQSCLLADLKHGDYFK